jgi:gliding motility-associated-like protein
MLTAITILLCLGYFRGSAQVVKQGSIWFVQGAKIDFKSDPPKVTEHLNQLWGRPSAICDDNGELLFYADGYTVWNAKDEIMENGDSINNRPGFNPITCVIVPHPGDAELYYLFVCNGYGSPFMNPKGLHYSVIDMSKNGGEGQVIKKEIDLVDPVSDLLTVVNHAEEHSFWVITHGWDNNLFYAFEVTAAGIKSPVITPIGNSYNSRENQLKASPDGSKLAVGSRNNFDVYDFNSETGVVSGFRSVYSLGANGVEFSPNSEFLYVGNLDGHLDQYDVSIDHVDSISKSRYEVAFIDDGAFKDIQLSYNGKIYSGAPGFQIDSSMVVIEHPNLRGVACQFVDDGLKLINGANIMYLPLSVQSFFRESPKIPETYGCKGIPSSLRITSLGYADSIEWNFGDGDKKMFSNVSGKIVTHTYDQIGTYTVIARKYISNLSRDIQSDITIYERPTVSLLADTILCEGETLILDAANGGSSYQWSTGDQTQTIEVTSSSTYKVTVNNGHCTNSDEVNVTFYSYPDASLGQDIVICNGDESTTLNAPNNNTSTYHWSTGAISSSISVAASGQYSIQVSHGRCVSKDTINVNFASIRPITFLDTTLIIPFGEDLKLSETAINTQQWRWNFGDGATETVSIPPITHHYEKANIYHGHVELFNDFGCTKTISFEVEVPYHVFIPNVFTPNGDETNESFEIQYNGDLKNFSQIVYDRYGKEVFTSRSITDRWRALEVPSGLYYYNVRLDKDIFKGWVHVIK